jgi:ABC-type multidrug transport system fused ATPase/permease subunit
MLRWLNESLTKAGEAADNSSAAANAATLKIVLGAVQPPEREPFTWNHADEPSLVKATFRRSRYSFFCGAMLQLGFEACNIGMAFTARNVMKWMINLSVASLGSTQTERAPAAVPSDAEGFAWLVLLSVLEYLSVTLYEHAMWQSRIGAHHLYQLLLEVLFDQVGQLEAGAAAEMLGPVKQLHDVHVAKASFLGPYISPIWTLPLMLPIISYLLYTLIAWPGLLALGLMLAVQAVQVAMSAVSARSAAEKGKCADRRIHRTAEAVQSMRTVKVMSWEDVVEHFIGEIRAQELEYLKPAVSWRAAVQSTIISAPTLIMFGVFGAAYASGTPFQPADVMTSILLMTPLRGALLKLPLCLVNIREVVLAAHQIEKIARSGNDKLHEFRQPLRPGDIAQELAVCAENLTIFSGLHDDRVIAGPMSFTVPGGKVTVVCGPTGSGKSLLLKAIAGEVRADRRRSANAGAEPTESIGGDTDAALFSFRCVSPSQIAVVAQDSWIFSASVRENIVLGQIQDEEMYQTVLRACQLESDLQQLPQGDLTVIGERGVTVSGGQRQRIALARAMYSLSRGRSVLLLDDPLSALDAHVGQKVLHDCILSCIGEGTTRVIATSRAELLHHADHCIVLDADGAIRYEGSVKRLLAAPSAAHLGDLQALLAGASAGARPCAEPRTREEDFCASPLFCPMATTALLEPPMCTEEPISIAETIHWYVVRFGKGWLAAVLGVFTVCRGLQVLSELTLVWWTTKAPMMGYRTLTAEQYFHFFALFCVTAVVVSLLIGEVSSRGAARASASIHQWMLQKLLRVPLRTFDVTPTGSLLANFSERLYELDYYLPYRVTFFLTLLFNVLGTVAIGAVGTQWVLAVFGLAFLAAWMIIYRTFPAVRVVKTLGEQHSALPANTLVEMLAGIGTIRSYQQLGRFTELHRSQVRHIVSLRLAGLACHTWQTMRICLLSSIAAAGSLFAVAAVFVSNDGAMVLVQTALDGSRLYASARRQVLADALVAVATIPVIPYLTTILVNLLLDLDTNLASVEQMRRFAETLPQEDEQRSPGGTPNEPSEDALIDGVGEAQGTVELQNVSVRYAPHLPSVLRSVSIAVPAGAKVCVVGRTGSGKSSLGLALLGLIDVCPNDDGTMGAIRVGGVDLRCFPSKRALRRRLSILPQDPILFMGTVRTNLDPYGQHPEELLLRTLRTVGMMETRLAADGLDTVVAERGGNFSQGERQLLCLARLLLKPGCRVLVMDEATASVDRESDAAVQRIVRSTLVGCTVLTIAHRLHAVATADLVLVLDGGRVVEFGPPRALLACLAGRGPPEAHTPKTLTQLAGMLLCLGQEEASRIVAQVMEEA